MKTFAETLREAGRTYLIELLATHPNRSEAARVAGLSRSHLYRAAKDHGVTVEPSAKLHQGKWDAPLPF